MIVRHREVRYVKANRDYVCVVTERKHYMLLKTMNDTEKELPTDKFVLIQKSYIVNLDFVLRITPTYVIMNGEIENIPIGNRYRKAVYERLGINGI